jgi:DNA/RNA endonuclease YhcR with UshA esterase domain
MQEKNLLKLALIFSLIGILLLFFISSKLEVDDKIISQLDENDIDSNVRLDGVVTDFKNKGSVILIDVAQLEKIQVVVFNSNFTLNKGDSVEIIGKIGEYEGNNQIIADKIILK